MKINITSFEQLKQSFKLTEAESSYSGGNNSLPISITSHYLSLIDENDPDDPLRKQVFPTSFEEVEENMEYIDPLAEVNHSITSRLVHRYKSRVAFLTTDICPMYCRHCFRRRFTGNMVGPATEKEIVEAAEYVKNHPEVTEILLTGGDLLTLSNRQLDFLIKTFRERSPKLIMRICTRMVITAPERIDDELLSILKKHSTAPFYLLTQVNHPRELCDKSIEAISKFIDMGIPALNQTVMLRGVNDDVDVQEELCNKLLFNRIKPYYVFQGDLVSGTAHLRVNLGDTIKIERELRKRVSGLAMPNFVSDLPQGGGKVPLSDCYVKEHVGNKWILETLDGKRREYPDTY
jgi:lysine 2,3-aminomutase